jgi:hypothetical protein
MTDSTTAPIKAQKPRRENTRMVGLKISESLYNDLKISAIVADRSVSSMIRHLIIKHVSGGVQDGQ